MVMETMKWYQIRLSGCNESYQYVSLSYKEEMFVGPHTRISGLLAAAKLSNKRLASKYLSALCTVFERRYGDRYELSIVECSGKLNDQEMTGLESHDEIIRERLATKNFAPNKKVFV